MILSCSFCENEETFHSRDNEKDFERRGWKIIAYNVTLNEPYRCCPKCANFQVNSNNSDTAKVEEKPEETSRKQYMELA